MAKTTKLELPPEVLAQHIAVLGKTGSGKTSTAKLIVEQVAAGEARVCVLDPIKSDWWGLTSSASGKQAGLPFHILGGPHGHVPLHSSAGAAIAEIVANGSLPLSVIDMADFEPGGISRFFVDFAPVLLKKMRGVVYLVIEEAHLFAPKERAGLDKAKENLSIHWAKTMATAGRSKGIRLIVATQRTQALHNAVLGSCDTVIAHRLTAPADQKPVLEWLTANAEKDVMKRVAASLAGLKTGHAWLCSGEARVFEERAFPRISTYDNTATPTGDGAIVDIKTAPVDQDRLRSIIGGAVEEAKANDPKELKRQLGQASVQLAASAKRISELETRVSATSGFVPSNEKAKREQPALTDADRVQMAKLGEAVSAAASLMSEGLVQAGERFRSHLERAIEEHGDLIADAIAKVEKGMASDLSKVRMVNLLDKLNLLAQANPKPEPIRQADQRPTPERNPAVGRSSGAPSVGGRSGDGARPAGDVSPVQQRVLNALAELEQLGSPQPDRALVALLAGYTNMTSKGLVNALGALRSAGLIDYPGVGTVALTSEGQSAAQYTDAPNSSADVQRRVCQLLGGASERILQPLIAAYPKVLTREQVAASAGYGNLTSKGFVNAIGRLRTLGFVDYPERGTVKAASVLFLEGR